MEKRKNGFCTALVGEGINALGASHQIFCWAMNVLQDESLHTAKTARRLIRLLSMPHHEPVDQSCQETIEPVVKTTNPGGKRQCPIDRSSGRKWARLGQR